MTDTASWKFVHQINRTGGKAWRDTASSMGSYAECSGVGGGPCGGVVREEQLRPYVGHGPARHGVQVDAEFIRIIHSYQ